MGPSSYMRSIVDRNVVTRCIPVLRISGPQIYYYFLRGKRRTNMSMNLQTNSNFRRNNYEVESSLNEMAHDDARERKWRGNWRMQWVASTFYTTSEHGVSSITTADAHTSAASCRQNWRRFKWTRPFRAKDEIWILRVCHHISTGLHKLYFKKWSYFWITLYITTPM